MDILKNKKGFTIIESMVVASIIAVALLGITSLMIQSMQAADINRKRVIASMLAQEGIELMRSLRDENYINLGLDLWHDGLIDNPDNDYAVDFFRTPNFAINNINSAPLYLRPDGYYTHAVTAEHTPFYRFITVEKFPNVANPDYIRIVSQVRWTERGRTHDYFAETYFYGWR